MLCNDAIYRLYFVCFLTWENDHWLRLSAQCYNGVSEANAMWAASSVYFVCVGAQN